LIAEHQLKEIRATVGASREAVLVADPQGTLLFANEAFAALRGVGRRAPELGTPVADLFLEAAEARQHFDDAQQQSWRSDWTLIAGSGLGLPVAVRAEGVPSRVGAPLGYIIAITDLSDVHRTAQARRHLEASLLDASAGPGPADEVVNAILTNASLAAMDIADGNAGPSVADLLEELETSAQRAAALYGQIRDFRSS
jgi:PAS domain-containing protein